MLQVTTWYHHTFVDFKQLSFSCSFTSVSSPTFFFAFWSRETAPWLQDMKDMEPPWRTWVQLNKHFSVHSKDDQWSQLARAIDAIIMGFRDCHVNLLLQRPVQPSVAQTREKKEFCEFRLVHAGWCHINPVQLMSIPQACLTQKWSSLAEKLKKSLISELDHQIAKKEMPQLSSAQMHPPAQAIAPNNALLAQNWAGVRNLHFSVNQNPLQGGPNGSMNVYWPAWVGQHQEWGFAKRQQCEQSFVENQHIRMPGIRRNPRGHFVCGRTCSLFQIHLVFLV